MVGTGVSRLEKDNNWGREGVEVGWQSVGRRDAGTFGKEEEEQSERHYWKKLKERNLFSVPHVWPRVK